MSAPDRVRTSDGMVWERRAETRGGLALYALEGVCTCPPFVMATLGELAEHGIQSAELAAVVAELGALPMPAGSVEAPVPYVLTEKAEMPVGWSPLYATPAALREDDGEHYAAVHHSYAKGRDLPELGGAR